MIKVAKFEVNTFAEIVYVAYDDVSRECAVIDPGMMFEHECERVSEFITSNNLKVNYVLLTHIHIDHVTAAEYVAEHFGSKVYAHQGDVPLSAELATQAYMFGLNIDVHPLKQIEYLNDNDTLSIGQYQVNVLHTPGHSLGGLTYYIPKADMAFVGDTIFCRSIGRTDLPGGSFNLIADSIHTRLFTLPPQTVLYPGHGPSTTVQEEIDHNPYV